MKKAFLFISGLFALLIYGCEETTENKSDSHLSERIENYLNAHVENGKFNGNVLITKNDSVVFSNSYGFANRELSAKISDSTKFLIGSITKPFTALGILLLEQHGKLKVTDKLSKYFPNFESANDITILQLLNHTSGISDYKALSDWKIDSKSDNINPHLTVGKMSTLPLLFEPGSSFRYSNVGYILLGLIIQQVNNQSFSSFIERKIIQPLNLTNTGIIDNHSVIVNLANGYSSNPRETTKAEYVNYSQPFSSGNMYSTTHDLLKFTKTVMNGELLVKKRTKEIFESGKYYTHGWGIRNFNGTKAFGHFGGMNGFVGSITYIPEGNWFICILTNDDNTPKVRITNDLVKIINNKVVANPLSTKLVELSDEFKDQVTGSYLVKPGNILKVFKENNRLYQQENGQQKHELFPFDNYRYSFDLLEFNVIFEDLENGKTNILKFVSSDTVLTAKRIIE